MQPNFIFFGSLLAFAGVAVGAFGAHALKHVLSIEAISAYQTGVNYHMWHAIGLFCIGLRLQSHNSKQLTYAGWLMLAGVLLFSGSLYLLAITGFRWLGMITPLGGMSFLCAWFLVCLATRQSGH
jgi:uncharacterized membrane protein YgdD (TMEM256/DUF423 family)